MLRWNIAQRLELWWWKRYLKSRQKSEYIAWKRAYLGSLMDKINLKESWYAAKFVLDIGCGPFGMALAHEGIKKPLTAVDPLIIEYERVLTYFKRSDFPGTTFIESTLENFESDQLFDFVFCLNAINHVENIEKSFDRLGKLCETGATLVLGVDAHNFSFLKYLFRWIPGDILHPHQQDLPEYEMMLKKAGFSIQSRYSIKKEFIFTYWVLVATRC